MKVGTRIKLEGTIIGVDHSGDEESGTYELRYTVLTNPLKGVGEETVLIIPARAFERGN